MQQSEFEANRLVLEAVAFNISQIGELAKLVDAQTLTENPHIEWKAMRGLRNRIVHDYDHVSPSILWALIQNDLAQLIGELEKLQNETSTAPFDSANNMRYLQTVIPDIEFGKATLTERKSLEE